MIFLLVSEDRNLLLRQDTPSMARKLYIDHCSITRIRRIAGKLRGTQHGDLWKGLKINFHSLAAGQPNPGLNPLGGFLFSENALAKFEDYELTNEALLDAVRSLSYIQDNRILRPIDYRNLGTEEFGSVYESLLELHPEINISAYTFQLKIAAGSERKTTGSYYTPASLIKCLLDSALEPVIQQALKSTEPIKALLELKVVEGDNKKIATLIRKQNREEQKGQKRLFTPVEERRQQKEAAAAFKDWEKLPEDAIQQVKEKVSRYGELVKHTVYQLVNGWLIFGQQLFSGRYNRIWVRHQFRLKRHQPLLRNFHFLYINFC